MSIIRNSAERTLALCGGGSGGHLFPLLAVVEELRHRPRPLEQVLFLTADRTIEQHILNGFDVEQRSLASVVGDEFRRHPWSSLRRMWRSVESARALFREQRPGCVIGGGGFGSLPGVLAAWRERIPIVLLEQNVVPGRATTFLCRLAHRVCVSFPETMAALPRSTECVVTGNPIRRSIARMATSRTEPMQPTLLILGGSQGALAVNRAMTSILPGMREALQSWEIVHQTGLQDCERVRRIYEESGLRARVAPFLEDMPDIYSRASLAVSRAGATSLAEMACAGVPAILIPYPGSVRDHQSVNARWYVDRGAAMMVEQSGAEEEWGQSVVKVLQLLLEDQWKRQTMRQAMLSSARPDAACRVADVLKEL